MTSLWLRLRMTYRATWFEDDKFRVEVEDDVQGHLV
jgi:hypothetical protein